MTFKFDWGTGLTEDDLREVNKSKEEDFIFWNVYVEANDRNYIVDIHHEKYIGERPCFDLEVYESSDESTHYKWLGSIKDIKTATHLRRFHRRVNNLVKDYLYWKETEKEIEE